MYQISSSPALDFITRWTIKGGLASALIMGALSAPGLSLVRPAYAQCVQTVDDVTCTGLDIDGFDIPAIGIDELIINDGATVTDTAGGPTDGVIDGVNGDVNSFENQGTITATNSDRSGVVLRRIVNGDFSNHGTITGFGFGAGVEIGLIETGSFINLGIVTGDDGVFIAGDTASISNSGTITGTGFSGFIVTASVGQFSNTGTITGTSSGFGVGIQGGWTGAFTNNGLISGGVGIDSNNDVGSLANNGSVIGDDYGVLIDGTISEVRNAGTISGLSEDGINAFDIDTLFNSGVIRGDDDGVDVSNAGGGGVLGLLINTGVIGGGDGAFGTDTGVLATVIANLVNTGTIDGNAFAIEERGAGATNLTLNAGSILIGRVDLGGGTNTLNIGQGLSLNSTFEETGNGLAALPQFGSLGGHLVAILDTPGGTNQRQVVAVDPSAFTSFDDALAALTYGIGGAVQGRQSALRSDPVLGFASRFAAADETSLAAFSDLDLTDAPHLNPNRFWIEGFGAYRQDNSDRVGGEFDHLSGGLVAGVDVPLDAITSLGVMAGFAASTSENEIDTQSTDTTSYYAGVYASTRALGLAWDASITVGYTDYEQERITANNLVVGGLETASADFGGWFINPQVTATREAANPFAGSGIGPLQATQILEQSLTLSYAGLFLDSTTETGTTNPLTLDDRAIHVASARAALALPFEAIHADGALTTLRLISGVEARTQFGDDSVSGTLLGQSVTTTLDDDDAAFGAFLGLSGEYQTTTGLTAYANTEALLETSSAYQISATAGLRVAF